jgi:hypothetical protein
VFPDWYKPYTFNYTSEGYFLICLGMLGMFGYSYMRDINEAKGRRERKLFNYGYMTAWELSDKRFAEERLAKGDEQFTKFLKKKERSSGHH